MILQHQKFRHTEWERINRADARWIILRQVARSQEECGILLDDLDYGDEIDCGTRGKIRRKPDGRKKRAT